MNELFRKLSALSNFFKEQRMPEMAGGESPQTTPPPTPDAPKPKLELGRPGMKERLDMAAKIKKMQINMDALSSGGTTDLKKLTENLQATTSGQETLTARTTPDSTPLETVQPEMQMPTLRTMPSAPKSKKAEGGPTQEVTDAMTADGKASDVRALAAKLLTSEEDDIEGNSEKKLAKAAGHVLRMMFDVANPDLASSDKSQESQAEFSKLPKEVKDRLIKQLATPENALDLARYELGSNTEEKTAVVKEIAAKFGPTMLAQLDTTSTRGVKVAMNDRRGR